MRTLVRAVHTLSERSDAGTRSRRPAPGRRRRGERGQGLVELTLTLPVLLTVVFGVLELGTLLDISHSISGLTREGANMASRGVTLDSVLTVTVANGRSVGLVPATGTIVTRVEVQGGVPMVIAQRASPGFAGRSKLGLVGSAATPLVGRGLANDRTYHVVEVFSPYRGFTPLTALVSGIVPDVLYDRSLF